MHILIISHKYRERWYADGDIRIAEMWRRERVMKTFLLLSDGRTVDEDQLEQELQQGLSRDLTIERERDAMTFEVTRLMMTGAEIVESPASWPGMYIPIIYFCSK